MAPGVYPSIDMGESPRQQKKTWVKILQPTFRGLSEEIVRSVFSSFLLHEMKVEKLDAEVVEGFITKCREKMAEKGGVQ